jgi:lysine-N-methylase
MSAFPSRPRLASHVLVRRHLVDGDERMVLFDLGTGRLVQIGPREWGLIASADGTRDLDGIVLAAAREGAHARAPAVRGFLEQLHQAGLLDDGVEAPPEGAPAPEADLVEDRSAAPLEPLPDFSLHCDGSGSCCRIYATVLFGPVEAARARALLPLVRDGGARHERVFTPERGSGPTGGAAVTLRDGCCAYLGDDGRCGLHAAGGPGGKPVGCNTFPASFIDDGESIRVSVSVECACVLASVDRPGGSSLLPAGARVRGDLDETLVIDRLSEHLQLTPSAMAPRSAYLAWSRFVAARPPTGDTAAAMWALADAIASDGLDVAAAARALDGGAPMGDARAWIAALHRHASKRAREDATWRSERDLARRATAWLAQATALLLEDGAPSAPITAARSEAFYLRALLHGHRLVGPLPLATALRDRAVRLVVARGLGLLFAALPEAERDSACAHPLALVEATLRGHGLDTYTEDVAG